jgi:hypothetical protein
VIDTKPRIAGIHVYPIKACRGVSLSRARISDRGLEHDRRWMVAGADGRFLSQREHTELALVSVTPAANGYLLEAPEMPPLHLPLEVTSGEHVEASVWRSPVWGLAHAQASRWFTELLGERCQVLYMPDASRRTVPSQESLLSFADGYPLLMISQASLDELNRRTSEPMSMARFRPNLVVSGGFPHFEDELESFAVGGVRFSAPKLCDRCVVPTIDPETGRAGREPLRTLAKYRRWDGKVWFGTNLIAEAEGSIELGQPLTELRQSSRRFQR